MLFHSLSGPEVHGVIDEMDRRAKSEAPAISSAIDRGDTETVGAQLRGRGQKLGRDRLGLLLCSPKFGGNLGSVLRAARDWTLGLRGQDARPVAPGSGETRLLAEEGNKVETEISDTEGGREHFSRSGSEVLPAARWLSSHFNGLFGRQPCALLHHSALAAGGAACGAGKANKPAALGLQPTWASPRLLAIGVPVPAQFQGSKSSRLGLFVVRILGLLAGPTWLG